jgi:hypothetical protein
VPPSFLITKTRHLAEMADSFDRDMFLDEAEGDELEAVSTYIKPNRQPSLRWQLHDPALTFFTRFVSSHCRRELLKNT